jgi:hypothetical protein
MCLRTFAFLAFGLKAFPRAAERLASSSSSQFKSYFLLKALPQPSFIAHHSFSTGFPVLFSPS